MNNLSKQQASQAVNRAAVESLDRDVDWLIDLRSRLTGRVVVPGDPDYDEVRSVFHGGIDPQPTVIARVANVSDVQTVISLARETGLKLAVRSGGHSSAGHGVTDRGIVLDLRDLKDLRIDPEVQTAWAETGLTAGEYTAAAP